MVMASARRIFQAAARADIFFYLLVWLIVLLVAGTVAQKELGLYVAQERYFSSFILWAWDVIPLPGGYTVMTAIFLNLFAKLTMETWSWKKSGTIVIHVGAMLLLLGGFLTAMFSQEGSLVIPEGETRNYVSDYHAVELAIMDEGGTVDVQVFSEAQLIPTQILSDASLPFSVTVEEFCRNCSLVKREPMSEDASIHGMYKIFDMKPAPLMKEDEDNRSGLIFTVSGAGEEVDGHYAIFEFMPVPQYIRVGETKYLVQIRHARRYLPFAVKLLDFEKQVHPGTRMARHYSSEVILMDNGTEWRSLIQMNEPLRYKGYTLFQSSFMEGGGDGEVTVLAVVKNIGRTFPYISSIIMCIGLLIHLFQRLPVLMKREAMRE